MTDFQLMLHCLQLAQKGKGHTTPNPMVGALLVHEGHIIGEGWHHYYGAAHAEVNCIDNVHAANRQLIPDCTMYVNLEPCAHYGLTPPCANRIVAEKIKRVVIGNIDPFEKVSGRGINILKEAGIEVISGVMEQEGLWVNRRFFCFHTYKRPYIVLKWAQTADGFIAPTDRSRLQITGTESQQLLHQWRTEETAIMVGFNTALNDNPQLTARLFNGKQPLRIILDRTRSLPHSHHIFNEEAATWIINEQTETISGNVHYIQIPFDGSLLPALMARLHSIRVLSIIIEGGAQLLTSFINAGLWDEARVFTGAIKLGTGLPAPKMVNASHALNRTLGKDLLDVFVNKNSRYPYIQGMDL